MHLQNLCCCPVSKEITKTDTEWTFYTKNWTKNHTTVKESEMKQCNLIHKYDRKIPSVEN